MQPIVFHTEKRQVKSLIPYDKNPRFLTPEQELQLTESLSKFGLVEIPAINADGTLIAGHQRVTILIKLGRGDEEIDVRVPDRQLTEDEFKEYNIRSNANTGSWNVELLATAFDTDLLSDWGLETSKFKGFANVMGEAETDEIPTVDESRVPVVKKGDIFRLGKHRIMCGDSKSGDVSVLMEDTEADMVFTDPPYNVKIDTIVNLGKTKHREFAEASGEMTEDEFTNFLESILLNLIQHSSNGSIHFICMDWKHCHEILTAQKRLAALYHFKQLVVWNKDNGGMGTFYRSKHELVFVFKKGTTKHINNFELGQNGRYRTNVWDYAGANTFATREKDSKGKVIGVGDLKMHPTVKPLDLVTDAILDCSNQNDVVLDLFLGSGTTLVGSERSNRICRAMELDPAYIEVSIIRYCNYMNQLGKPIDFSHVNGKLKLMDILNSDK
jgi:DNA modification methylase